MQNHLLIQDRFFDQAISMRSIFDDRFAQPLEGHSDRFVWDYWHVPDQYTLLRTPADHYFSRTLFNNFIDRLTRWGQTHLGCSQISPPWLSCYIDGCEQGLHADNPHGPWAFVYSLTNWSGREFEGGETFIHKPETLDYWNSCDFELGFEKRQLVERIDAEFNRLIVFDPSYPHGVTPVKGSRDPRNSRLVIHGWFTDPAPDFSGALSEEDAEEPLNEKLIPFFEELGERGKFHGIMTVKIAIASDGGVKEISRLASSLKPVDMNSQSPQEIFQEFTQRLSQCQFPKMNGDSEITLPILFN